MNRNHTEAMFKSSSTHRELDYPRKYDLRHLERNYENLNKMLDSFAPARRDQIIYIADMTVKYIVGMMVRQRNLAFANKATAQDYARFVFAHRGEVLEKTSPLVCFTAALALARIARKMKEIVDNGSN